MTKFAISEFTSERYLRRRLIANARHNANTAANSARTAAFQRLAAWLIVGTSAGIFTAAALAVF